MNEQHDKWTKKNDRTTNEWKLMSNEHNMKNEHKQYEWINKWMNTTVNEQKMNKKNEWINMENEYKIWMNKKYECTNKLNKQQTDNEQTMNG